MSEILTINTEDSVINKTTIQPLPLYDENHYMLRSKVAEYSDPLPNPIMTNLVQRLIVTKEQYSGIGLSANQCGVSERFFVIGTNESTIVCINPKVLNAAPNMVNDNEGCLSFPGLYCKIYRPGWVDVEYTTPQGEVVQTRLEGLTARCFLHELDHLNGIRFVDYVKPLALKMARQKQEKRIKTIKRRMKI
jgi:peptide deformylase